MDLEELVAGLVLASICGVGAMAFRSDRKWPVFYELAMYASSKVGTLAMGAFFGAFGAMLVRERVNGFAWTMLGISCACFALYGIAWVANWLREPKDEGDR